MNIEKYVCQLLDDIAMLRKEAAPYMTESNGYISDEEKLLQNIADIENHIIIDPVVPLSTYCGLSKDMLPEVSLLSEEQLELLNEAIMGLLLHYNIHPVFFFGVSVAQRYEKIRAEWSRLKAPLRDFNCYFEFCSYDENDCPFPGSCKGCEERQQDDESLVSEDAVNPEMEEGKKGLAVRKISKANKKQKKSPQDPFISGIFNYCDKWCERCSLSEHCLVFAMGDRNQGKANKPEDSDWGPNWETDRQQEYRQVKEIIKDEMQRLNITAYDLSKNEGFNIIEREGLDFRQEARELMTVSEYYSKAVSIWMKNMDYEKVKATIGFPGIFETITWYSSMISVKMFRSFIPEDTFIEKDHDPIQSDANGTAKLVIKATKQSLYAWSWIVLNRPSYKSVALTFGILLTGILEGMNDFFPDADKFIRPGFDQEEADWLTD